MGRSKSMHAHQVIHWSFLHNQASWFWSLLPTHKTLPPCKFWLLLKLKELLHGVNFEIREELIAEVREQLKLMPTSAFLECFQKWIHRANKTCDYVEKGKMLKKFSGFGLLPSLGKSGTSLEHSDGDLRQRPKRRNWKLTHQNCYCCWLSCISDLAAEVMARQDQRGERRHVMTW